MGQLVMGVLWGVEVPVDISLSDEDGEPTVLNKYAALPRVKTADEPSDVFDDGLLGFWVTVQNSDDEDVPDFGPATPFVGFAGGPYAKSAKKRWEKFTTWASAQGMSFPLPQLYLARTEVA